MSFEILNLNKKLELKSGETKTLLWEEITSGEIILNRDSSLTLVILMTESLEEKMDLRFSLTGDGSNLKCIILNIGRDKSNFEFDTTISHIGKNTSANLLIKTVLSDHARTNTTNNIDIKNGATKTNSELNHNTILLSPNAKVRTIPCLEILEDDVKAGHGATIGSLNDEWMYYLNSRGISKDDAKILLTQAFIESGLEEVEDEEMREYIRNKLNT